MEILHIIPAKKSIAEFLRQMEKRFDLREHSFMTLVSKQSIIKFTPELLAFPFLETFEKRSGFISSLRNMLALRKRLQKADHIIWHGLSIDSGKFVILLKLDKVLCKKSVWIEQGADEESWVQYGNKIKKKIFDNANKSVRSEIPIVGAHFGANQEYVKSLWPEKKVFFTPYPLDKEACVLAQELLYHSKKDLEAYLDRIETGEPMPGRSHWPNIQIGQNSQRLNHHERLIKNVKEHFNFPKNVFLPVNYTVKNLTTSSGTDSYRKNIEKTFCNAFKDNAYVLKNTQLEYKTYFRYLNSLDIIVLGAKYCFDYSNLILLLASGATVFLPENSFIFHYLANNETHIYALERLADVSISACINRPSPEKLVLKYIDTDAVMTCWSTLFEHIKSI